MAECENPGCGVTATGVAGKAWGVGNGWNAALKPEEKGIWKELNIYKSIKRKKLKKPRNEKVNYVIHLWYELCAN